jgi:hypothetical protein
VSQGAAAFQAAPDDCEHTKMPHGFEHLNEPARQCQDCGAWLCEEWEEAGDGDGWFWFSRAEQP